MPRERPAGAVRRRIEFDAATWHALHKLSLDSMKSLQDLVDETFRDLLKKHRRPVTLMRCCGRVRARSRRTTTACPETSEDDRTDRGRVNGGALEGRRRNRQNLFATLTAVTAGCHAVQCDGKTALVTWRFQ
jgi:hypothetical protein